MDRDRDLERVQGAEGSRAPGRSRLVSAEPRAMLAAELVEQRHSRRPEAAERLHDDWVNGVTAGAGEAVVGVYMWCAGARLERRTTGLQGGSAAVTKNFS